MDKIKTFEHEKTKEMKDAHLYEETLKQLLDAGTTIVSPNIPQFSYRFSL